VQGISEVRVEPIVDGRHSDWLKKPEITASAARSNFRGAQMADGIGCASTYMTRTATWCWSEIQFTYWPSKTDVSQIR